MANAVRIKARQTGLAGAPASLRSKEIAFNEIDNKLYYGKGADASQNATSIIEIGGPGAFVAVGQVGAASGVCPLGADSKVAATYLPSYVDDVVEAANLAAMPATGETGKIYVAQDTNKTYRWSGTVYIEVSPTAGNADSATKLATPRNITATGDAAWTVTFDGSANASGSLTLASIITAGTFNNSASQYQAITADAKGRITAVGALTNIVLPTSQVTGLDTALTGKASVSHTHSGTYQPLDADLSAIAGLAANSGILQKTAADTWALKTDVLDTSSEIDGGTF